jgi:hypothetical protein
MMHQRVSTAHALMTEAEALGFFVTIPIPDGWPEPTDPAANCVLVAVAATPEMAVRCMVGLPDDATVWFVGAPVLKGLQGSIAESTAIIIEAARQAAKEWDDHTANLVPSLMGMANKLLDEVLTYTSQPGGGTDG